MRFDSFTSDRAMKGHYQCFVLAQDATLVPTQANILGGGFLPDCIMLAPGGAMSGPVTFTLPTGAEMEVAFSYQVVGDSWCFRVVNLDPTHTITVAPADGFTVSGSTGVVFPMTCRVFEVDKIGANIFDCYSLYSHPAMP